MRTELQARPSKGEKLTPPIHQRSRVVIVLWDTKPTRSSAVRITVHDGHWHGDGDLVLDNVAIPAGS
jgi:hypothetical protein